MDGDMSYASTIVVEEDGKWVCYIETTSMSVIYGAKEYLDPVLNKVWYALRFECCCRRGAELMSCTYKAPGDLPDCSAEIDYMEHRIKCKPKKEGNGKYLGKWAFTLTCSPTDNLGKEDLLKAVRKVMSQKSCPVLKYAWYYENKGSENGKDIHPHIHGMYELEGGGRIEAKHWKRAWSIWDEKKRLGQGFRGGYHRPVRSDEGYSDYIAKDGNEGENNFENDSIDAA